MTAENSNTLKEVTLAREMIAQRKRGTCSNLIWGWNPGFPWSAPSLGLASCETRRQSLNSFSFTLFFFIGCYRLKCRTLQRMCSYNSLFGLQCTSLCFDIMGWIVPELLHALVFHRHKENIHVLWDLGWKRNANTKVLLFYWEEETVKFCPFASLLYWDWHENIKMTGWAPFY